MSILPYRRNPNQSYSSDNSDEELAYKMVTTPYVGERRSSSTDNYSYALDTNAVNVWYRNVMYAAYDDPNYTYLFSPESVDWMSAQISLRLRGVHPEGKNIVVPDETILSVADSFRQSTGYNLGMLQEQVVLHIVSQIVTEFQTIAQNDKLSAWVQLYSMDTTMRQFNDIKLNERRGTHGYVWNY